MTKNFALFAFTTTVLALASPYNSAFAAFEDRYLSALESQGKYKCKDTPLHDGTVCLSKDHLTYVVVPRGMKSHERNIFYAHGLTGVCRNPGASGENYLRNEAPTLLRLNAIAVMPYRQKANDESFPMSSFVKRVEKDMGSEKVRLSFAGHSAAGSFLGSEISSSPELAKRADNILLIDAIYGQGRVGSLWSKALSINPEMKIQVISSTTAARSKGFVKGLNKQYPGSTTLEIKSDGHCNMPKYFQEL
ncbi:MAG: hypothetical protein ACXWQO_16225, partial [Bdellovibrionota bacterium]